MLNGAPVAGATVRLIGSQATLGTVAQAAARAATAITWTRQIKGLSGTLWTCWQKLVANQVAGLTWPEFRQLAGVYNPGLAATRGRFALSHTYFLPENKYVAAEIAWDRPLRGFAGTLWACWQQYVANKVVGLAYRDFTRAVLAVNPALAADGRFVAEQRYNLPRNVGQTDYELVTTTGKNGRFGFEELPAGDYRVEVTAAGALPFVTGFSCREPVEVPVALQPLAYPAPRPRGVAGGFVGVAGTEFLVNDAPFRFIGVNVRGLVHYGDPQTLQWATEGHRAEQLQAAYDMGARVVRVFLPSIHATPQQTEDRLRSLVALVKARFPGLYILPALCNLYADVPFRVPGDDAFYRHIDPNFPADLLTADFFTGGYQNNYLPFDRQIVEAFRAEPAIFAWEIGNELKLNPITGTPVGDPNVAAFVQFMLAVARTLRQLDPNHLITTGMISTHHAWLHTDELKRRLYASPDIDFLTVHCYNDEYENDDSALAEALHKPFIVEEAGYGRQFGGDRSTKVREDMQRWFGRNARGYLQWGFMATGNDIGDGDQDSGMDRTLHGDWNSLFNVYREHAVALAQVDPNWQKPLVTPPTTPSGQGFGINQQVYAQTVVNVRKSAGHVGKAADDTLGQLAYGAPATITGAALQKDDLTWWPVHAVLADGQTVDGWAAEAVPNIRLLGASAPPPAAQGPRGARRLAQSALG